VFGRQKQNRKPFETVSNFQANATHAALKRRREWEAPSRYRSCQYRER